MAEANRRPLVVANWKMNVGLAAAQRFIERLRPTLAAGGRVDVALAPSYPHLAQVAELGASTGFATYAQNCHQATRGAHTGEVSVEMLREIGVEGVIVGHSERRREFGEPDDLIRHKVEVAGNAGLAIILCVGETLEERAAERTREVIERQLRTALGDAREGVDGDALALAYEPVWAIGTGQNATTGQVGEVVAFIREVLASVAEAAAGCRVLYGGSVTADNATELAAVEGVDGALVGGASLDPTSFAAIIAASGG